MFGNSLPLMLTLWMVVIFAMSILRQRRHVTGVGLVLCYLLNLWILFWAGSSPYLFPWYRGKVEAFTISGTELSLYALLAFAFGSIGLTPWLLQTGLLPRAKGRHVPDEKLPRAYFLYGCGAYVLVTPLSSIPSAVSIVSVAQELVVVGVALSCLQAWSNQDSRKLRLWLFLAFTPPLITMATRGYIGFGVSATFSILIFLSTFVRQRSKLVLGAVLLGYLGLSVFVTYMRERGEIRRSVWSGRGYAERFGKMEAIVTGFEWFDPTNVKHLGKIDERLNQSFLAGAAIAHLTETGGFVHGRTIWEAVYGLIPRAVWPGKPTLGGSGDLVGEFTGIEFDSSTTSIGIGQVMEFYVNFGVTGVVIGFAIFGLVITVIDSLAAERLVAGDLHGFVLWYLPGLAFLQVGGSLVEVLTCAVSGFVVASLVNRFLDRLQQRGEPETIQVNTPSLHGSAS